MRTADASQVDDSLVVLGGGRGSSSSLLLLALLLLSLLVLNNIDAHSQCAISREVVAMELLLKVLVDGSLGDLNADHLRGDGEGKVRGVHGANLHDSRGDTGTDTERDGLVLLGVKRGGKDVANTLTSNKVDAVVVESMTGSSTTSCKTLSTDVIHKIVHLKGITASKHTGNVGLEGGINDGSVGARMELDAHVTADFVLGDKTNGKKKAIALHVIGLAHVGLESLGITRSNGNTLNVILAVDGNNGVAQVERNLVVLKALNNITLKTVAGRKNLKHTKNIAVLKGHTTSHDQTDITRAKDDDVLAGQMAVHVNKLLGKTSGENTSRTRAGDLDGCTRTLTATGGNDNRAGNDVLHTLTTDKNAELLVTSWKRSDIHHIG